LISNELPYLPEVQKERASSHIQDHRRFAAAISRV
jgi:hypothetical protein